MATASSESLCSDFTEKLISHWVYVKIKEQNYIYSFNTTKNSYYDFFISDFSCIYYEKLNLQAMETRCKEINPNLEIRSERLLELIELSSTSKSVSSGEVIGKNNQNLILKTKTIVGFPFLWNFQAKVSDSYGIRDHLINPLLGVSSFLMAQNDMLVAIIEKKDLEIEDLKNQGAKVSRKYLETEKFQKNSLNLERNLPAISLNSTLESVFSSEGQFVYQDVVKKLNSKIDITPTNDIETKIELKSEASVMVEKEIDQSEMERKRREELSQLLSNRSKTSNKRKKIKF